MIKVWCTDCKYFNAFALEFSCFDYGLVRVGSYAISYQHRDLRNLPWPTSLLRREPFYHLEKGFVHKRVSPAPCDVLDALDYVTLGYSVLEIQDGFCLVTEYHGSNPSFLQSHVKLFHDFNNKV